MAKRYPRLGYDGGNIPRNSACKACGATEGIRPQAVQVNWFRGDDDVHPVCKACKRLPEAELLGKLGYRVKARKDTRTVSLEQLQSELARWKPVRKV